MKHLKSYENNNLKKFILIYCKEWNINYYLIEVIQETDDKIYYNNFYYYNNDLNDEMITYIDDDPSNPLYLEKNNIDNPKIGLKIIYQTDDIEDGKKELTNMVTLNNNQTKYNL
jgi:hypothetical protein